jgi:hypothetical protein
MGAAIVVIVVVAVLILAGLCVWFLGWQGYVKRDLLFREHKRRSDTIAEEAKRKIQDL